ncbi:hypothetical protein V8G54_007975 [Vigna mungo]|uniref:Phosphorylated adapter RNA export protein n=1 Tax=Vigna mungo TaxID=3915 RepID=A0AAQ3P3B6_VIGMU
MVYTAVGCLGISALSDLVSEVLYHPNSLLLTPFLRWSLLSVLYPCFLSQFLLVFWHTHAIDYNHTWVGTFCLAPLSHPPSCIQGQQLYNDAGKLQVDAIQACGGQKTADGRRFRTGGGILWSILKVREPKKQFKQPNVTQRPVPKKDDSSQGVPVSFSGRDQGNVLDSDFHVSQLQNKHEPAPSEEKPISVHDRLRIPVSYDDDLLGENPFNDAT